MHHTFFGCLISQPQGKGKGMVLLDLPEALTISIVKDWLGSCAVIQLDSALCNRAFRSWWEPLLQRCSKDVFKREQLGLTKQCSIDSFVLWVMNRKLEVPHLFLSKNIEQGILEGGQYSDLLSRLGPTIQSIIVCQQIVSLVSTMPSIAAHCPNLKWLDLQSGEFEVTLDIAQHMSRCTKLQHLNLHYSKLSEDSVDAIASGLTNLKFVEMLYSETDAPAVAKLTG